ncbi:hypothetical protein FKM82_024223 [Ascaphus truei]
MYAIIDDQSNRSLVRSEFFDMFGIQDSTSPYTLRTCAGRMETTGRRVNGYTICSIDGKVSMPLPTLIECNHMAEDRTEIPTPDRHHESTQDPRTAKWGPQRPKRPKARSRMGGSWRSMHRQDTRTRQRRRPTDELVGERSYIPLQTLSEPLSGPREARDQKELRRRACGKKIPQ